MSTNLVDFYSHVSDLKFSERAEKIDNNYGITAMDDGDGLVIEFDLYKKDTLETIVEIYIAVETSFIMMNLIEEDAQVTLQPKLLDGNLLPKNIDNQLITDRIEHLVCTDYPELTYQRESNSVSGQPVSLFTHVYNPDYSKKKNREIHTKLLNILLVVRYCYVHIKKLYNQYKDF